MMDEMFTDITDAQFAEVFREKLEDLNRMLILARKRNLRIHIEENHDDCDHGRRDGCNVKLSARIRRVTSL